MGCKVVLLLFACLLWAFSSSVSSRMWDDENSTLPAVVWSKVPTRPKWPRPIIPPLQRQNYYKLVQTWAPGYCSSYNCANFEKLGSTQLFFIHGLWPESKTPVGSILTELDIQNLMNDNQVLQNQMNKHWPTLNRRTNIEFWAYEWNQHGRYQRRLCPLAYFQRTVHLATTTDLLKTLEDNKIVPGNSYSVVSYKYAILQITNHDPLLKCVKGNVLSEVVICVDEQTGNFRHCPGQSYEPAQLKCREDINVMFPKWAS